MGQQPGSLWRHPEFLKLWAGQTISQIGSQVTLLALPLNAVLVLHATPGQMGLLYAAETAPFLVVGLAAGVWVDRLPRRPILIGGDLGRALLLGLIPVAPLLDLLRIEQLYVERPVTATQVGAQPPRHADGGCRDYARGRRPFYQAANRVWLTDHVPPG